MTRAEHVREANRLLDATNTAIGEIADGTFEPTMRGLVMVLLPVLMAQAHAMVALAEYTMDK